MSWRFIRLHFTSITAAFMVSCKKMEPVEMCELCKLFHILYNALGIPGCYLRKSFIGIKFLIENGVITGAGSLSWPLFFCVRLESWLVMNTIAAKDCPLTFYFLRLTQKKRSSFLKRSS